jgi:hypothetical protein
MQRASFANFPRLSAIVALSADKGRRRRGTEMDGCGSELQILRARMSGIGARLDDVWAAKLHEQRHLDRNTTECAYWHSGYHQALADVLSLISNTGSNADTSDRSSPLRTVG